MHSQIEDSFNYLYQLENMRFLFFHRRILKQAPLLFAMISSLSATSQMSSVGEYEKRRNVVDNGIEMQFEISLSKQPKHFHPSKEYFWIKGSELYSTMGGGVGKFLNGAFVAFHPNGQLKEKGSFCLGVKEGDWTSWNEQGKLISQRVYRKGVLKDEKLYNLEGKVSERFQVICFGTMKTKEGQANRERDFGSWKRVTVISERKKEIRKYVNGLPRGKWKTKLDGKIVKIVIYKNHQIESERIVE